MPRIRPGGWARLGTMCMAITVAATALSTSTGAAVEPPATAASFSEGDRSVRPDDTDRAGFIGSAAGKPIETGATRADAPAAVAEEFVQQRGRQLGLTGTATGLRVAGQLPLPGGGTVVRLDQTIGGVPVLGGEFAVSLDAGRDVMSVLGEASPLGAASITPSVAASAARDTAVQQVARETRSPAARLSASTPVLMFYDPRLLDAPGPFQTARLSWVLEVRGRGPVADLEHQVVVDAASGIVALSFSTIAEARNRVVCDANNTTIKYPCTLPDRTETMPPTATDDADVRAAFDYAGDTYDFFFSRFGRDSLDGAGMRLVSTTDWCPSAADCPYQNAFWDGRQMVYGDGFASADDVVGHELTHGVTDFSSRLFYYQQSGAINEAMSDVFGELIDLTNTGATHGSGGGTDTPATRWLVGEDIPVIGAIRDMEDPPSLGQPDRMLSPLYDADPSEGDGGGVHTNSGVANKAAYLMTDGGSFNGQSVSPLGVTKTARLFYTVNTSLLVSGSDYADLANALRQGCRNLAGTGTDGITSTDCSEVDKVVLATEMDQNPPAAPTTTASVCPSGTSQALTLLADDLEVNRGQLTPTAIAGRNAWFYPQNPNPFFDATYATSGSTNIWGDNAAARSDSALRMTNAIAIPPSAFLHFQHAFGFADDATGAYDGGVVEFSTAGPGGPWVDAGSLFATPGGGGGYSGSIAAGTANPLAGRAAFVRESFGYGASRADLSSLAGQSVRFRWRIGTDSLGGDFGWFLDDLRIGTCSTPVEPSPAPIPTTVAPAPPSVPAPNPAPPAAAPLPTTAADTTAPQTSITKGPRKLTSRRGASFRFAAESGAQFRCKLDRKAWRPCTSPKTFRVALGRHTFRVVAIDAARNIDPTPARYRWRVRR